MATEDWKEAAFNYNLMSERARAEYWGQLTPDQQNALREALTSTGNGEMSSRVAGDDASTQPQSGCGSRIAAGCIGLILGVLFTVGLEIAAVMMGVSAIGDALQGFSGGNGGGSTTSPNTNPTSAGRPPGIDPNDPVYSVYQQLIRYCGTDMESKYREVADACANERVNEKIYRERQQQQP
jgi:hypothetical protein